MRSVKVKLAKILVAGLDFYRSDQRGTCAFPPLEQAYAAPLAGREAAARNEVLRLITGPSASHREAHPCDCTGAGLLVATRVFEAT
jgi:hypothetical protein